MHHNKGIGFSEWGAGGIVLWNGNPKIFNCLIFNNDSPRGAAGLRGGGINLLMKNTLIVSNRGTAVMHLHSSSGTIINCTIVNNDGRAAGGNPSLIEFRNCILWNNASGQWAEFGDFSYSDVEENVGGIGNINQNPLFVNENAGNYYLQLGSPCIDTGDLDQTYNDIDGSRNDMGGYGGPNGESYTYQDGPPMVENVKIVPSVIIPGDDIIITTYVWDAISSVSSVHAEIESPDDTVIAMIDLFDDGLHNDGAASDKTFGNKWTTPADSGKHYFIDINAVDDSSHSRTYNNAAEFKTHSPITIYVDQSNISGIEDGTLAHPYNTISEAIDVALRGDTVNIFKGVYVENIKFNGKNIVLKSDSGPDSTTIDGNQKDAAVIFDSGEDSTSIIEGFTIRNGKSGSGGGILCISSSPIIRNNRIVGNYADGNGGGISCEEKSSPLILKNLISGNWSGWDGAGINCGNSSNAVIRNNIICYNNGENNGGGIFTWDNCAPKIYNNLIFENTIKGHGAGINAAISSSSIMINNTIVFNHCQSNHGGIHVPINSTAEIRNNICWFNDGQQIHIDNTSSAIVEYCNVQNEFPGTGNINVNPFFFYSKQQEFYLQLGSPCIDAGDPNPEYNDIDGTRNDMGAYGGSHGVSYSYPDGPPVLDEKTTYTNGFVKPGDSITIYSFVYDLVSSVSSVVAEIENPDEVVVANINLYDDGLHNDDLAGDDIWANNWITDTTPHTYYVDIMACDDASHCDTLNNGAIFTTNDEVLARKVTDDPTDENTPSCCQTITGRYILVYEKSNNIWYKISDDGGQNWSHALQLTFNNGDRWPNIAETGDGIVFVTYERGGDVFYLTSTDNGNAWSTEYQFTNSQDSEGTPRIGAGIGGRVAITWTNWNQRKVHYATSVNNGGSWQYKRLTIHDPDNCYCASVAYDPFGKLHIIWSRGMHLWHSESSNNGVSWSSPEQVTKQGGYKYYASMDIDKTGTIWVAYPLGGEYEYDIYYTYKRSEWSEEIQFTTYVGRDFPPDVTIMGGVSPKPYIFWESDRWNDYNNSDIWMGIMGQTQDLIPPPRVDGIIHDPYSPAPTHNDIIAIRARALDEAAIESAFLIYSVNGQKQSKLEMYDDGMHRDDAPRDDIWAVEIGAFPVGTIIEYQVKVKDVSGNTILTPKKPNKAEVIGPFEQTSYLLLVADYNWDYSYWLHYYTDALDAYAYSYDVWDSFLRGSPDSTELKGYTNGAVIWFTPFSGYIEEDTTQASLQYYLDSGGKLFITGQDIGASIHDSPFYTNYLHANFIQDNAGASFLSGVTGDPISDGLSFSIIGGDGANNQLWPSEIEPIAPAVPIFTYGLSSQLISTQPSFSIEGEPILEQVAKEMFNFSIDKTINLSHKYSPNSFSLESSSSGIGAIRVYTGTFRVVYFAFGFEGIDNATDRAWIMNRVLNWLSPSANAWIHVRGPEKAFPGDSLFTYVDFGGETPTDTTNSLYQRDKYEKGFAEKPIVMQMLLPNGFNYVSDKLGLPVIIEPEPGIGQTVTWQVGDSIPDITGGEVVLILDETIPTDTTVVIKLLLTYENEILSNRTIERNDVRYDEISSSKESSMSNGIPSLASGGISVPIPQIPFYDYRVVNIHLPQVRAGREFSEIIKVYEEGKSAADLSKIRVEEIWNYEHDPTITSIKPKQSPLDLSIKTNRWSIIYTLKQMLKKGSEFTAEILVKSSGAIPDGSKGGKGVIIPPCPSYPEKDLSDNSYLGKQTFVNSKDPNDIHVAPTGYIKPGELLNYIIEYENEGSVEAIDIKIVNKIEVSLETRTLSIVGYNSSYDARNREITWDFKNINLQPDSGSFVNYSIEVKDSLVSGTEIRNKATIYFDFNPGMDTPEVVNIIDATKPSSQIDSVFKQNETDYLLYWSGIDEHSGIKDFTIYVSDNDGNYEHWITDTTITSAIFTIQLDHKYTLYTIAKDSVGNVEEPPDSFDVKLPLPKEVPIEIENIPELPSEFALSQNYPNPFNPQTTIRYQLPQNAKVRLEIYNILGQKVRTLINERQKAGYYQIIWDGQSNSGQQVTSGIYLFRLKANDYISVKKALILR